MLGQAETGHGIGPDLFEKRLALIHRVLVPDDECPMEYAVLVTSLRSVFIRQPKARRGFVLRYEMMMGTAMVTGVIPKTLEDYRQRSIESLASDNSSLVIPHDATTSLAMKGDALPWRRRDFFVKMVMNRQQELFQVYNFEMKYRKAAGQ